MVKKRKYPKSYFQIEKYINTNKPIDLNRSHQEIIDDPIQKRKTNKDKNFLLNTGFPVLSEEVEMIKREAKKDSDLTKLENYFQRSKITIEKVLEGNYDKISISNDKRIEQITPKRKLADRRYKDLSIPELHQLYSANERSVEDEIRYRSPEDQKKFRRLIELSDELRSDTLLTVNAGNADKNNSGNYNRNQYGTRRGKYEEKRKDCLERIDDPKAKLIDKLKISLEAVINEQQRYRNATGYDITNGRVAENISGNGFIYEFDLHAPLGGADKTDNIPASITIEGNDFECNIITIKNNTIIISADRELNLSSRVATIKIDMSFLNMRLLDQLELIPLEDNETYKPSNASKVFGQATTNVKSAGKTDTYMKLNDEQKSFLNLAIGADVAFLWGPPGTGKTHTLAQVIYNLYRDNKKVLLVSNTNSAIDTLLLSLCKSLNEMKDQGFEEGAILRDKAIADEELKRKFDTYVNIDEVAKRKTKDLQEKRSALLIELAPLETEIKSLNRLADEFEKVKKIDQRINSCTSRVRQIDLSINSKETESDQYEIKLVQLKQELLNTNNAVFKLFKRDAYKVEADIRKYTNKKSDLAVECKNLKLDKGGALEELKSQENEKESLLESLQDYSEHQLKSQISKLKLPIEKIQKKVSEIDVQVSKVKDDIYKNIKVIGTTATQVYLRPKIFTDFDAIVIDEASMINLPTIYYLSCLSKDKVILSGDFQQLPPIVQINREDKVFEDYIKDDIFIFNNIPNLVEAEKLPKNVIQLEKQYRMTHNIQELINNKYYRGKLNTQDIAGFTKNIVLPDQLQSDIIIVDTSSFNPYQSLQPNRSSRFNLINSVLVREVVHKLVVEGKNINGSDIGVVTPYAAQSEIINSMLKNEEILNIESGTVHRFQGKEKNIIIYDIPETRGLGGIGRFFSVSNTHEDSAKLHNVAISRSRGQIIFICDFLFLKENLNKNSLVKEILVSASKKGKIIGADTLISKDTVLENIASSELQKVAQKVELKKQIITKPPTKVAKPRTTWQHFDQNNFFDALRKDIKNAKRWITIYSGFIYMDRVSQLAELFQRKLNEGVRITCRFRLPEKGRLESNRISNQKAISELERLGVNIDYVNEEHRKYCFIDDNILYHGSLNVLSLPSSPTSVERMTRETNKSYIESVAKNNNHYRRLGDGESNIEFLNKKHNPQCENCSADTYQTLLIAGKSKFTCINKCGYETKPR